MALVFNSAPYWNDWSEEKGFLKVLYKPSYPVQGRELIQTQDILQNQISRFGSYVFKSGSAVLGGQLTLDTNVTYANVQPLYQNTSVNLTQFSNNVITDVATRSIRATVVAVSPQVSGLTDPPTMMLKYLTGITFSDGANVTIESSNTGPFALLANTNSQGVGSIASMRDGIYFIDMNNIAPAANTDANTLPVVTNAYFVRVPAQTIILDKYDAKPSYRIGLQVADSIVTTQTDSSLFDPALGSSNYQAPGADRYIINVTLSNRSFTSQDDTAFIELMQVANGTINSVVKYPVLSDINDTLARRTYDQAGSYTVTPFTISLMDSANNDVANANTSLYYVSLNAGKAYIQGYEQETVSKTILAAPKARANVAVNNFQVPSYFGNYVTVDTVNGEFNMSALPAIDIHCVSSANVNTASSIGYANTLIGTARLRAFEYNGSSNTASGLSYIFRAHLFDVNTGSFIANTIGSSENTVTFPGGFSGVNDAYTGMPIVISTTGDSRTITGYDGGSKIATVDTDWTVNPLNGTQFTILGSISAAESIGLNTRPSFITANANINVGSRNQNAPYTPTTLTDTAFQSLIFRLPNSTVAAGLQNPSYEYRYRIATNQTLQPGTPLVVNLSIPGDTTAVFASAGISGSDLSTLSDFLAVTNPGSTAGQIIPMTAGIGRSVAATTTTATFTMASGDPTFTNVDIFASVKSTLGAKTKTLVTANTVTVSNTSGVSVGSSRVTLAAGQIFFATPATTNLKTPGVAQDLYISDAINIVAIIDSGSIANPVTPAMVQAAVNNTAMPGGAINATGNYTFYNGQKDSYYDHATITLNAGAPAPLGQVVVFVNYYSHSTSGGYFTVDSYPNYTTIPIYQTNTNTGLYALRDCIDFRPRRDDATTSYTFANSGPILLPEPFAQQGFNISFSYYLGRIDRIILTQNGDFRVIQGVSSLYPGVPAVPDGQMLLYTLTVPPYTFYSANITPQMYDNKRYTMRDIGTLETRIKNLEYYTQLNALEKNAANQNITDANGLSRPKNGILVDNFQGTSIADVTNLDYYASIDMQNQLCRPAFEIQNVQFDFNTGLSAHYAQSSKILTLPYSVVALVDQPYASRTENLNPFNLTNWLGTMKLDPESDTWVATQNAPAVVANLTGDNDAWAAVGQAVNDSRSAYSTVWNNWQTVWTGVSSTSTSYTGPTYKGAQVPGLYIDQEHADNGWGAYQTDQDTVTTTTSTTAENQARTGIQTTVSFNNLTTSVGDNVINVSVIPYIRTKTVLYFARSMKPLTNVYPFFDNVAVQNYTMRGSVITFTSNVSFQQTYGNQELIYDTDGGTNGGVGANSAHITMISSNKAWVDSEVGVIVPGKVFKGYLTGQTATILDYQHYSGLTGESAGLRYQGNPTLYGDSSHIVLAGSASSVNNYYNGNTLYIVSGTSMGKRSTITAYDGTTRTATVSPPFSQFALSSPQENFHYSIGSIMTDPSGDVAGTFVIPDNSPVLFPTGTSVFRLIDSVTNDVTTATTRAEDSYTAQGTLQTLQQQYVSTRVPVLTNQTVTDTRTVVSDTTTTNQTTNVVGYQDPLAQTFLIDATVYPDGLFITSVRVCFFSKDNNIPVTLQIRPTVNGFPNSGTIIPLSQVIMLPNYINVTSSPNLDDPTQYTEFVFDAPINLLPGTEYAIVLISNSNNYEVYSALVGDKLLGSDRLISTPPYAGVLFKSQNSSTWTPYQGESLMFRVLKAVFDTSQPMTITFNSPASLANTPIQEMPNNEIYFDTMYVTTSDQVFKDTTLSYGFRSTSNTSRSLDATYTNFIPETNYAFSDRKVLVPTGNSFYIQASGRSISQDVSPVIDTERYSILAIANEINNAGISNGDITITNPGRGYNIANTNVITVSGNGTGAGAQLAIGSVDANGNITSVYVTTQGSGTGYTQAVTANISTSGYSPATTAKIAIASETNPSGGNMITRYITRMVTLTQDSGDLNVAFSANKPNGTQLTVYYKILSAEDNDLFANKPWVQMSLDSTDRFASTLSDYIDYNYVGAVDQYGNPIRSIFYSTFNTFRYFAIKVCFTTNNPAIIPKISGLQVFAMPATN